MCTTAERQYLKAIHPVGVPKHFLRQLRKPPEEIDEAIQSLSTMSRNEWIQVSVAQSLWLKYTITVWKAELYGVL